MMPFLSKPSCQQRIQYRRISCCAFLAIVTGRRKFHQGFTVVPGRLFEVVCFVVPGGGSLCRPTPVINNPRISIPPSCW